MRFFFLLVSWFPVELFTRTMKTLAYPIVIGLMITLLCQITFVANYRIIFKKNNYKSNYYYTVYTCQVDDPKIKIYETEFYCKHHGEFLPFHKWVGLHNDHNIFKHDQDLRFQISSMNKEKSNLCNEYSCSVNLHLNNDFSNMSNPIIFNLEEHVNRSYATEKPPPEVKVINKVEEGRLVDLTEGMYLSLKCIIEPHTKDHYAVRWFFNGKDIAKHEVEDLYIKGPILEFDPIEVFHQGVYVCEVLLPGGYSQQSNELIVPRIHFWMPYGPIPFTTTEHVTSKVLVEMDTRSKLEDIREYDNLEFNCRSDFSKKRRSIVRTIWRRNGEEVFDDVAERVHRNGRELLLQFIRPNATGSYTCEVETVNAITAYISKPVEIFVKGVYYTSTDGPNLRIDLVGRWGQYFVDIDEDKHEYFICHVEPNNYQHLLQGEHEIQWFQNNNRIQQDYYIHFLRNNSFLVLSEIRPYNAGMYSCQVQLANGGVLRSNNLRVRVVKKSLKDPYTALDRLVMVDRVPYLETVMEDDSIQLKCRAYPIIRGRNVIWYRDGYQIYPDKDRIRSSEEALLINGVRKSDAGNYTCKVATFMSTVGMPLSVLDAPENPEVNNSGITPTVRTKLGNPSHAKYVLVGETMYFICDVNPDTTNIRRIGWYFKDQLMEKTKGMVYSYLFRNFTMVVENIEMTALGQYHCQVETKDGKSVKSDPVLISVRSRENSKSNKDSSPYFLISELRQYPDRVFEGDNTTMFCNIFPRPNFLPEIEWFLNGTRIHEYISGDPEFGTTQRLKINLIRKFDVGNYTCQLTTKQDTTYTSLPVPQFEVRNKELKEKYFIKKPVLNDFGIKIHKYEGYTDNFESKLKFNQRFSRRD